MSPFTIKTFYPSGDPDGLKISEITRNNIQAFYIPRVKLKNIVKDRKELEWNGVYILFDELFNTTTIYIGEAENLGIRLKQHLSEDWWSVAIAFFVNNECHQLSKSDIKFLENMMYNKAKEAQQMTLYNLNIPHKSFVEEDRKYDLLSYFENIDILLQSFNLPVFVKYKYFKSINTKKLKTMNISQKGTNHTILNFFYNSTYFKTDDFLSKSTQEIYNNYKRFSIDAGKISIVNKKQFMNIVMNEFDDLIISTNSKVRSFKGKSIRGFDLDPHYIPDKNGKTELSTDKFFIPKMERKNNYTKGQKK